MSEFDPGEGWRPVPFGGLRETDALVAHFNGHTWRSWVRVAPVPPLPTEPYTVIRVTWRDPEYLTGSHIYTLASDDYWVPQNRNAPITDRVDLQPRITGFEVLAEPHSPEWVKALVGHQVEGVRRDTAKAVLDQVRAILPIAFDNPSLRGLEHIGHQFGVGK